MKTKKNLIKSWLLMMLMLIGVGGNVWAEEKTLKEGFEQATAGSNYQGEVSVASSSSDCGIGWDLYYGCVSTSSFISGSRSAALRLYTTDNYGFLKTTTPIEGLKKVSFSAKAATSNSAKILINISSSNDGTNWTTIEADKVLTSSASNYECTIPSGGKYFQISISSKSTKPTKSSAQLTIDDVVFTYESSGMVDPTITFASNPYILEIGKTVENVVRKPDDLDVTYESDDGSVVSVDEEGKLTGVSKGTATITVSWDAVDNKYNAGSKEFTVNVVDKRITFAQTSVSTGNLTGAPDGVTAIFNSTYNGNNGTQLTANNEMTLTLTGIPSNYKILGVVLNVCNNASKGSGTATVNIGQNTLGTLNITDLGSNYQEKAVSITPTLVTGDLIIHIAATENSVYCNNFIISYEITDEVVKDNITLAFPQTAYEATIGSEFTAPTVSAEPAVTGIEYSSSNESVATVDANTGEVTLVAAGTTLITASFVGNDDYNPATARYTLTVTDPNAPGTQNNPYTVAQARAAIDAGTGVTGVYATGIVSEIVTAYSSQYGNITYNISVDGSTTADQLQAFRGKSFEGENFTSENDIQVGDKVVIYGDLTRYGETYEFGANNQLVSLQRPVFNISPSVNISEGGHVEYANGVITAVLNPGYRFADPAYTIFAGTATVTQDGNQFIVKATSDCEIEINFEQIPSHNVVWSVNGTETTTTALEDAAVEFPANPESIEGKTFVGWVTEAIDGETNEAPTFVTSATMGTADVTYYAVFASQEGSGVPASLTKMTSNDTFATGDKVVIVANDVAMYQETTKSSYVNKYTYDNSVATVAADDKNWLSVSAGSTAGTWKFGDDTNGYVYNSGSNNLAISTDNSTDFSLAWDDTQGKFTLVGNNRWLSYRSDLDNKYFRMGGQTSGNASGDIYFDIYKYNEANIAYSGYCTTVDVPIVISTVEELKAFRDAVNGGNQFAGKTVKLAADLDLSGEENWTPIGNLVAYPGQSFNGVFDGNVHTIKNVTVVDQTPNHAVAGLFGSVVNGTIKNLTVENVNLTSSHYAGGIVAYTSNKPIIENCHVIGGTITSVPELINGSYDNGDKVGGIMGYATAGSTINNCTVDGLTIKAYRDMGGIVGFSAGNVTNNTVKNTTIIQSDVNGYKDEVTTYDYIVGRNGGATLENNVYEELNNVLTIDGAVAKIGETLYRSLAKAVTAAQANDVITLIADDNISLTTASSEITIDKPLTITGAVDENGKPLYTIYGSSSGALDNNSFNDLFLSCATGTVTVSNIKFDGFGNEVSSVMGHSPIFIGGRNNEAVVENVYISNLNCEGIHINGGSFTIRNSNIDCSKTTSSVFTKGICVVNEAHGSIEGTTISGVDCENVDDTSAAIELQGSGAVSISGCTIESNTIGIAATPVQELTAGTSQVTVSNCTVASDNIAIYGNGDNGALITILSGSYSGLLMAGDNDEGLSISGGIFDDMPELAYCAEGYIPVENTDEATKEAYPYKVKEGQFVAEVDGEMFETLTEAIAALTEENNTITLLADIAEAYTLAEAQSLNVNLNGHTINVVAPEGYILQTSEVDGVTTYSYAAPVAKIGDAVYASLAEAVAAVPTDGTETTITMIDNEAIASGITIPAGKNIILELNGKVVSYNSPSGNTQALITNRGTLVIQDNTDTDLNGTGTGLIGADYTNPDTGEIPGYASNTITNGGTLTIKSGKIINTATKGAACYVIDNNSTTNNAILNIEGGYIYRERSQAVRLFCNSTTYQNAINISGGIVEGGYAGFWIQLPGDSGQKKLATVNITGGELKGGTYAWYDYSFGDSFEAVNYSVSGGKFNGDIYSFAVADGVKPGFITGGLFASTTIEEDGETYDCDWPRLLAEGLACTANTDETTKDEYPYAVGEAEIIYSWVENGTEYKEYHLFATPFVNNYLMDGESITLLKNVTLTEDIACQLAEGSFNLNLGDYTITKGDYSVSLKPNVSVLTDKQTDIFSAAEAGYMIEEAEVDGGFTYTAVKVEVAAPIVFHDGGTYEEALTVPMIAQVGAEIYYSTDGESYTKYTQPIEISATTTVTAYAMLLGAKSAEVTKTFEIVAKQVGPSVTDSYYNIKAGNKFVNVAGRKTVTLVDNTEGMPGTVIRVKATDGKVETLRSQGVDVPGYAQKVMNYVPEIVRLAVDKLHAVGAGELLGEHGMDAIMTKFNESFDYNLYLEKVGETEAYRIYGRTPSMKPVVDFYAENKDNVDAKLPQLEQFINQAIDKVLEKTGGRGAGILVDFDLETVWENMGGTLTKPEDEASTAKFYEEVLTSEANVWNFAYQTAMIYWGNLKDNETFKNNLDKLGDYAKYIDKVENIQPNFKYYIVPSESGVDFISKGNIAITDNDPSVAWTMESVDKFNVNFDVVQNHTVYSTNGGVLAEYSERYTTLYTDFAYELPEGVKAYKVKEISDKDVAVREEIEGTIPAQTPVMLVTSAEGSQTLTLTTEDGTAITGNLLVGADALINEYQLKNAQVESLFNMAKDVLGETAYNEYLSKYEHLMLTNAGTVNNKYFFGLTSEDVEKCVELNDDNEEDCVIRSLSTGEEKIGFYNNWTAGANQAFLISSLNPVKLWLVGDVNRDGSISIADVTALVNIILGKATYPADNDKYDFEAANVNGDEIISISDVTKLVNMILGKE